MAIERTDEGSLGAYLKARRRRLNPAALGFSASRRRTPGLRREEVAQRANISATWYTWLEQGRGGAPSANVLDRVASALLLTDAEREHVFLMALGRLPDVRYKPAEGVTPRLQRVLDAMQTTPAILRTMTWDVVAWNAAAAAVLTDYAALPPDRRNILRLIFLDAEARAAQVEWDDVARFVVAVFRAEVARAGATELAAPLVAELSRSSPEFAMMWETHDVRSHGDGVKMLRHPILGLVPLEYSAFAVDGRPDLSMITYHPTCPEDAAAISALVRTRTTSSEPGPWDE
ncbi:helix-turn-helix transcriptional regulator [Blastomonas sp.]|jgi:transcriptional regulator with XRE-family HTH domain|uniref:helix-turn-helix transcriptional regulator n=1 Tax=Blastomonas TaxID=150203 RepID=UPI0025833B00|nr:helix-turn-helix transcriptional regulator [Blastomonas sp.]